MIPAAEIAASLDGTTEDDYPRIEQMIDAALAFLSRSTARHFGPVEEVIEYLTGRGDRSLWLSDAPVGPVEVVHDYDDEVIDAATYDVRGVQVVRKRPDAWWSGTEYRVEYERGYTEETLPDDIRQAVHDLVSEGWTQQGKGGLKSETIGGYSYTRADVGNMGGEAATRVDQTIQNWRRVRL
jgi:hypothetical protein